ncbi:NUDIX domain-containing protein [Natrarchaeobius halalkaliphilus]|uniref:NUDIX domain-containing protein n=1 Tax=Natrarchaeobius halalkaliphilus TaxID=1679091 RepID=A0A3N6NWX7_9EURY|nr:NUDIX domain-containing protein [Natrarchaeobius halalkaliphilus]RQG89099.1 NUDIX domain-containing protein [Natrarchaeobius halalkaliphilus]
MTDVTYVQKACAYITRSTGELLVFEGPGHDGLQIPKGTLETDESPKEALFREVLEESGLGTLNATQHLSTDVWTRRRSPPKRYVRHFFHSTVHEPRDRWTHRVTDGGDEHGSEFELYWVRPSTSRTFALDLDDYVQLLPTAEPPGDLATASD